MDFFCRSHLFFKREEAQKMDRPCIGTWKYIQKPACFIKKCYHFELGVTFTTYAAYLCLHLMSNEDLHTIR